MPFLSNITINFWSQLIHFNLFNLANQLICFILRSIVRYINSPIILIIEKWMCWIAINFWNRLDTPPQVATTENKIKPTMLLLLLSLILLNLNRMNSVRSRKFKCWVNCCVFFIFMAWQFAAHWQQMCTYLAPFHLQVEASNTWHESQIFVCYH